MRITAASVRHGVVVTPVHPLSRGVVTGQVRGIPYVVVFFRILISKKSVSPVLLAFRAACRET